MHQDAIMEEFWILHDSEYVRFLQMQALHKMNNALSWIMMNKYEWMDE